MKKPTNYELLLCPPMAYVLILALLFQSHSLLAQITVSNSSYIFSNDRVVFVEDDVNLKDANSMFYLRNESQLIQGSGVTGNSGIGKLSVYQEGNVGAHEYNYWCSPIGSITNNSINNPFGVSLLNDITSLTNAIPATSISSAGYNGTASPLNIEPFWIWKFIASDEYAEWLFVGNTSVVNAGEGFTMKGVVGTSANNPGDNQRYDFRGKPNNGTMSSSVLNNQYTLVGNPYPSSIDSVLYIHDIENASVINGTLYYWEQDLNVNSHLITDYEGGYSTFTINSSGTILTNLPATFHTYDGEGDNPIATGGNGTKQPLRYIPIGQGFMVEGQSDGVVKIKNEHRVYIKESNANSIFYRNVVDNNISKDSLEQEEQFSFTQEGFPKVPEDCKRFRVNIDFNDLYTRQVAQTFHHTATKGFDYGLESKSPKGLASDAFWVIDDIPFVAQAFKYDETLKIPIVVSLDSQQTIRFRILDIQNFEENQPIFIHDKSNEIYLNLRTQDYTINLEEGLHKDRFEITFVDPNNQVSESSTKGLTVYHNNEQNLLTILNPNEISLSSITLFDVTGKQIFAKALNKNTRYEFSTKNLSNSIYAAILIPEKGDILTKKILITKN